MAGRTPEEARTNFVGPLQRALSCVSHAVVFYRQNAPGEQEVLILSEDPVRLTRNSGPPLLLTVDQQYVVVESTGARGPWKVSTRGYRYQLTDESERELAGWHWHPHGNSSEQKPHVHVYQDPLTGLHLPTGRVSVESVLRMLLTEFGVRPCRADWEVVLNATEAAFVEWRMWG